MAKEITNLEQMLNRIDKAADEAAKEEQPVTLGQIVAEIGGRSFGPLLLMAGLIITSPLSGFPGMPTTTGLVVVLIAGQLVFGRQHLWLPRWLLNRSVERIKVRKMLRFLRTPAHFVDRLLRPRLPALVEGTGTRIIAIACAVIAVGMPVMEMVPFSAHAAGVAVTAFALALIARDGLLALLAFMVTAATYGAVLYNWLT